MISGRCAGSGVATKFWMAQHKLGIQFSLIQFNLVRISITIFYSTWISISLCKKYITTIFILDNNLYEKKRIWHHINKGNKEDKYILMKK